MVVVTTFKIIFSWTEVSVGLIYCGHCSIFNDTFNYLSFSYPSKGQLSLFQQLQSILVMFVPLFIILLLYCCCFFSGGVGNSAERRMNIFVWGRMQIFIKQCRGPHIFTATVDQGSFISEMEWASLSTYFGTLMTQL